MAKLPMNRAELERAVHAKTHSDFKGRLDGVPTILVLRTGGTTLVTMSGLTDEELDDKARALGILPALPPVACKVCSYGSTMKLSGGRRKCGVCDTVTG